MKKIALLMLTAILVLILTACLLPETPPVGPEDDGGPESAILIGEEGINLKEVLSAINSNSDRPAMIYSESEPESDGEIVFGQTNRPISTKAADILAEKIAEKGGELYDYSGYLIYKDSEGKAAVCWSDISSKKLALEKFISDYSDLTAIDSAAEGVVFSDVFDLSEYLYKEKWKEIEAQASPEVTAALKHLANNYYDGPAIVDWIASLWEPYFCACGECSEQGREIACFGGAFYYADSARDYEGFWPDIESTGFLLNGLAFTGAFEKYGNSWSRAIKEVPGMTESLIKFVQALQDKDSGYFYHPQWGSDITPERRGRDLNRATQILNALGAKPLYPTAIDRLNGSASATALTRPLGQGTVIAVSAVRPTSSFEASLESEDTYMEWLREITKGDDMFKNSSGAHTLDSVRTQIVAAGYLEITLDYLDEMAEKNYSLMKAAYDADPENNPKPTGLWQNTVDYNLVWGLIKLSGFYSAGNRPYKYPVEALESCVEVIMFDPSVGGNYHMNDVMNQWGACERVLTNAKTHYPELLDELYTIARENAVEMIKQTEGKLAKFIQEDGSYGYCMGTSSPTTQGVPVSLGFPEGDSNANEMAKNTYGYIFTVLGYPTVKMCDWRDGERVLKALRESSPVIKQHWETDPTIHEFDDLPSQLSTGFFSSGYAEIVDDPEDGGNPVLKYVTKPADSGDTLAFKAETISSSDNCFVFDVDFYVESANRSPFLQIKMEGLYMFELLYRDGAIRMRDNATTANANKITDFDREIELNTWFNLRIEYYVDATDPTIKVYIDGDLIGESHNYFGSQKEDPTPATKYNKVTFFAPRAADATVYIDNAGFYTEAIELEEN